MVKRNAVLIILLILLAGCQALGGEDEEPNLVDDPAYYSTNVIDWDHSPTHIVFQADVLGGQNSDRIYTRNIIPPCTIYGNGRVVWYTNNYDSAPVLYDMLDDRDIEAFIDTLTVHYEIFTYTAEADLQFTSISPTYEKLTVSVNGETHESDIFGGWDIDYFNEILDMCTALADTPTIFEPTLVWPDGGWISAATVGNTTNSPFQLWSQEATGIDLAALAQSGERQWIEGRLALAVWRWLRDMNIDLQFVQDGVNYYIGFEVPTITRDASPPPEEE